jgi:excisionase family DNA binding protein
MTDFTPQEMVEIETLTLTKKIARGTKGALTAKQLGEMLSISPKTIFKLARAGRIPSFRIGTAVRFDARLVIGWFDNKGPGLKIYAENKVSLRNECPGWVIARRTRWRRGLEAVST